MGIEFLDVIQEDGSASGKIVDRITAHREGILHRTSHVWLFRFREELPEVLLQKRSDNKDSYPGCYDISTAGHIPAGVDYISSAIREAKEELGIIIDEDELIFCGQRRIHYDEIFHGENFIDNQISNVYLVLKDVAKENFVLQKEEISDVCWMDFTKCCEGVKNNSFPNCIMKEELDMLSEKLKEIISKKYVFSNERFWGKNGDK